MLPTDLAAEPWPKVSVVIPAMNEARNLPHVFERMPRGTYEVILVDGNSTDDTVAVIRSFKPAKLIQIRAEEYVPGVVLNRGMREAASPWVVFLNSDCEPADSHWLSELLGADIEDLGTDRSHRAVGCAARTAKSRALPGPATARIKAYLTGRTA